MDQQTLIQGLVTVAVGAVSGGITNAVAIWMLFHPYESRGLGPFRIHGAIPKNKARLARSIGRTVGERLLTPEDLAQRLGAPAVREAFDRAMGDVLDALLEHDEFLVLADYAAYVACQDEVSRVRADLEQWTRMSILNVARMGYFSSDRAVQEYCNDIWRVVPVAM